MNYFIYGAGRFGKLLYRHIKKYMSISIEAFLVTEKNAGEEEYDGVPIYAFDEFKKLSDLRVLIAIDNEETTRHIKTKLISRAGLDAKSIIDCSGFIRQNLTTEGDGFCLSCGRTVKTFSPGGIEDVTLFREHHIIGGGIRNRCVCPLCGSVDRTRWILYVLTRFTDIFINSKRVLHIAPEPDVSGRIKNRGGYYVTGDINPQKVDIKVDLTDIQFKDGSFDYVIANHVLEHIPDVRKAAYEIKRVLDNKGVFVCSFPICTDMETDDDASVKTPEERLERFGQSDHVRLYGYDFRERIEEYGFEVSVYSPKDFLDDKAIEILGFIPDDIVLLCQKKEQVR